MTLDWSEVISYEMNMTTNDSADWQFDQGRKVGAVTTKQVIEESAPVLVAIHYGDDCSWAFLCDTTEEESDSRMVTMEQMLELDPSLNEIADMQPGWIAYRDYVGDEWERFEEE